MEPYRPESLPLSSFDWPSLINLIGPANAGLARYDGILQGMINPSVLLSPLTTQEAVLSSKIEGTQATLEEVLEYEESPDTPTEKKEDIREIINYRIAMQNAIKTLSQRPISLNLIKEVHLILLDSVRGQNKARGEFRDKQNWIGKPGSPIEEASFVPPPPSQLMEHLSNFENYVHHKESDRLIQLAIVHAQFELIHPFLDGNGRVGRILIPLFLYEKGLLSSPMFYLSAYLEKNRDAYYGGLSGISSEGNWNNWFIFFLKAIIEQSKVNSEKAKSIIDLYDQMKVEFSKSTRSQFSIQALDALFDKPIFTTTNFINRSGISKNSALKILHDLEGNNILTVVREGSGRRPTLLIFNQLINLVEGKNISAKYTK
jgi:Fic family protein